MPRRWQTTPTPPSSGSRFPSAAWSRRRARSHPLRSPADSQAVAEEEDALAIVVGPSHRGALGRVVPGSVGERLLRSAPCPVAVAPSGYRSAEPGAIRRIGVGFTPEPEADEALAAAVGIAARTGAAIQVLSVVEPPSAVVLGFAWGYGELEQTARDDLAGSLAGTMAEVASRVEIDGEVVDGYADDELARRSTDVDLLICGSHRRGALGRVMLGSVSAGVMRKARCPVLIVPRGAPDGFAELRAAPQAAAWPSPPALNQGGRHDTAHRRRRRSRAPRSRGTRPRRAAGARHRRARRRGRRLSRREPRAHRRRRRL